MADTACSGSFPAAWRIINNLYERRLSSEVNDISCSPFVGPGPDACLPAEMPPSVTPTAGASAIDLENLPAKYTLEEAIANGNYVNLQRQKSNEDKLSALLETVSAKEGAAIRIVNYTIEGAPIITDMVYDGNNFTVWEDSTRDAFGAQKITQNLYQNLLVYEQEGSTIVFLTN